MMTVFEIRPHRWGWKVFEAPGVEPAFPGDASVIGAEDRIKIGISRDLPSEFGDDHQRIKL